jgi:tRNA (mo5U34)-methyltransferase
MLNRDQLERLATNGPRWMYEFDLGDGLKTPLLAEELRSIHQTRVDMIFREIDRRYPQGLKGIRCLDVACNEGYFSHLLYQRGADVSGIDIRPSNIERALAIRDVYGLDSDRLRFKVFDFYELSSETEACEIVLFLGLLYHLENPMLAIRKLHRLTKQFCVIETQLTRQHSAVTAGWGETGVFLELPASMAIHRETDADENNLASFHTLSFIPNAAAVHLMLESAGFREVAQAKALPGMNPQYLANDRGVFFASQ